MKRRHFSLCLFALLPPLLLVGLFQLLKSRTDLMARWVSGFMAPVEQFLGRLWSHLPFSVAEILTALFLAGCVVWLVRAMVLLVRRRELAPFLRRLLALVAVWFWLWAGVCWLWNAAYYAPSFAQRSGLETAPYSVEKLASVTREFAREAARLSTRVARAGEGHFAEELRDCFDRAVNVYDNLSREFPFLSMESVEAKPLICSRLQSVLGLSLIHI